MKAKEPSRPKETNQVLSTSHQQQELIKHKYTNRSKTSPVQRERG